VDEYVSVLQAYDAVVYLLDSYGPESIAMSSLWSDFYYTGLYNGVPNSGDPGSWYDWLRAVKSAIAKPVLGTLADGAVQSVERNRSCRIDEPGVSGPHGEPKDEPLQWDDRITALQAYDAVIRIFEQYSDVAEVVQVLAAFKYTSMDNNVPNCASSGGWYEWLRALRAALDDPLATDDVEADTAPNKEVRPD